MRWRPPRSAPTLDWRIGRHPRDRAPTCRASPQKGRRRWRACRVRPVTHVASQLKRGIHDSGFRRAGQVDGFGVPDARVARAGLTQIHECDVAVFRARRRAGPPGVQAGFGLCIVSEAWIATAAVSDDRPSRLKTVPEAAPVPEDDARSSAPRRPGRCMPSVRPPSELRPAILNFTFEPGSFTHGAPLFFSCVTGLKIIPWIPVYTVKIPSNGVQGKIRTRARRPWPERARHRQSGARRRRR